MGRWSGNGHHVGQQRLSSQLGTGTGALDDQWPVTIALGMKHKQIVGTLKPCSRMRRGHIDQTNARTTIIVDSRQVP